MTAPNAGPSSGAQRTLRAPASAHGRSGRRILLVACLLVVLPVAVAVIRQAASGWMPDGDDAWMARRTMQVASAHPPLLGQESTASEVPTSDGLSHPGPVAYYLMALPYGLSGWSPVGLLLGAGLIVAGSLVAVVALAWSVAGDRGALGMAVGVTLASMHIGVLWLVHPASSVLVVMPLLAAVMGAWAYAWGTRWGLIAALGFGSFALQTSLVVLPIAAVGLLGTAVVAGVRWVRTGVPVVRGREWWAVGAIAAAWVLPIIDQATRAPGNLADLVHYLWSDVNGTPRDGKASTSLGGGQALGTVLDFITNPWGADGRALRLEGIATVTVGKLVPGTVLLFVVLAALAGGWSWHRRDRIVASIAATAAVLTIAAVLALSRRPNQGGLSPLYYVLWIDGITALWWAAFAMAGIDASAVLVRRLAPRDPQGAGSRSGRPVALGYELAVGTIIGVLVFTAVAPRPDPTSARVRSLSSQIRDEVPPSTVAIRPSGLGPIFTAKGVGADLIAHGYDARFDEWGGMVDERSRAADDAQASLVFVEGASVAESTVPGRVATYGSGSEAIGVWFLPGGKYAPFCTSVLGLRLDPGAGATLIVPPLSASTRGWPAADVELVRQLDAGGRPTLRAIAAGPGGGSTDPIVAAGFELSDRVCTR